MIDDPPGDSRPNRQLTVALPPQVAARLPRLRQVVAVADGEVTIAGEHESYRDTTVQIRHTLEDGTYLISHYTHLSSVTEGLEVGDVVDFVTMKIIDLTLVATELL